MINSMLGCPADCCVTGGKIDPNNARLNRFGISRFAGMANLEPMLFRCWVNV